MSIPCNEISYDLAKSLYNTEVVLLENKTGKTFKAFVTDTCFKDQTGFIVRIARKDAVDIINEYEIDEDERQGYVSLDARNIFSGEHFSLMNSIH